MKSGRIGLWVGILGVLLVIGGIGAIVAANASGGKGWTPGRGHSLVDLQEDFKQFNKAIMEKHPKLYDKDMRLSGVMGMQYARLREGMSEEDLFRILAPVVAELGCGHTMLMPSKGRWGYMRANARYFPLEVAIVDDRLYVLKDLTGRGIPKGAEVVGINGASIPSILGVMYDGLGSDGFNTTKKLRMMNRWFNGVYHYLLGDPDRFSIEWRHPGGETVRTTVAEAVRDKSMDMEFLEVHFRNNDTYPKAEYHKDYAVLRVPTFNVGDKGKYKSMLEGFFKDLKARGIGNLVLDLRGNWGGEHGPGAELYSYLINVPSPYFAKSAPFFVYAYKRDIKPKPNRFTGKLVTLIDGASFSTTAHLCALLKFHGIGTFVGEESGGSATCTSMNRSLTLRNTGIRLTYSTRDFTAAAPGLEWGRGIRPAVAVSPTLSDYLEGSDGVMRKAVETLGP